MPRRRFALVPQHFYHVYNRGVDRRDVFFSRENSLFFLRRVREYLLNLTEPTAGGSSISRPVEITPPCQILAYCLMPNHFHLLVQVLNTDFSTTMQSLSQSYTNAINRERDRVGPLFQGRFQAKPIDDEAYLLHVSRYIHLNPVVAHFVDKPEDWEFSSYSEYIGTRDGSLPQTSILLGQVGRASRYRGLSNRVSER
jgi:putative transposase